MDLQAYGKPLLQNYAAPLVAFERGEGSRIWDTEGRSYLDFSSGIAVTCLGHSHPKWIRAVREQAEKLVHCTNLFAIPEQGRLAERIVEKAGPGKMLFCNSGAEANETLIKLARLHGQKKAGGQEGKIYKIVTAVGDFHGRTYGAMSATHGEKIRKGFAPLAPGFEFAKFNDLADFEHRMDDQTAAVLIEPIQGESGVHETDEEFLIGLRSLCDERGILLMLDEVQTGMGRTGDFFAFNRSGISPDAIALAKGLGGGFPIGAAWVCERHAQLFTPGSHGTTFGGSPLACAAAHAVLDVIEEEDLVRSACEKGESLKSRLVELSTAHPDLIKEVRGRGFMIALSMMVPAGKFVEGLREEGLITVPAGGESIRLLPPLNASDEEIQEALAIIEKVVASFNKEETS